MATTKSRRRKLPKGVSGPHRNKDGSISYHAHFQLKGFGRPFKAHPTAEAAIRWLTETKATLVKQREAGQEQPDLATMTLANLNEKFLREPQGHGAALVQGHQAAVELVVGPVRCRPGFAV